MKFINCVLLIAFLAGSYPEADSTTLINGDVNLILDSTDGAISLTLLLNEDEKLSGQIGGGFNLVVPVECEGSDNCLVEGDGVALNIQSVDRGFNFAWSTNSVDTPLGDCFDLLSDQQNWYGGPEHWTGVWPIETAVIANTPYSTSQNDYWAIVERYWLNSRGGYIWIQDEVPLFLDQNTLKVDSICFLARVDTPYLGRDKNLLAYNLVAAEDPKLAHLHAVENYLGKPSGHPNEGVIRQPIWTTWSKYKTEIDDEIIRNFALDIVNNGFTGQIEIDDYWEECYGSLTFSQETFNNITHTVAYLKELGFTVSLWTHPFVNDDCVEYVDIGKQNDYFVKNISGSDIVDWWNGELAYHLDFTKEEVRNWFVDRLTQLQELHGLDSYKFDAGEADWAPPNPVLIGDINNSPNLLTSDYVRTCALFGDRIEVRAGWRTQDLPVLVRMLDKDSRWGLDDGLQAQIIALLQMNMVGYTMVLPDIIGGDGYGIVPSPELLMRWVEANTFMPAMQFSFLPWDYTSDDFDSVAISLRFVALHAEYADEILTAMNNSITKGIPVNPPVWWVDPTNPDAWKINDEYLLGETILVAPVVQEGAVSRDIFLPLGVWKDGNTNEIFQGPRLIEAYAAPIDVLPYFIKT